MTIHFIAVPRAAKHGSGFGQALLDQLDNADLSRLAELLSDWVPPVPALAADGWLSSRDAAEHLGISIHALHRLTAERSIPFSQDSPGARCYFRRSALDAWRS